MPTFDQYPSNVSPNNSDYHLVNNGVSGETEKITREDYLAGSPLPDDTVTTDAIADGAVTAQKISPTFARAQNSGAFTINATAADIPGATLSVNFTYPSTIFVFFSATPVVNGTSTSISLDIDGTSVDVFNVQNAGGDNAIIGDMKVYPFVAPAGAHTLKLRASRGAGGSSSLLGANNAMIFYLAMGQ